MRHPFLPSCVPGMLMNSKSNRGTSTMVDSATDQVVNSYCSPPLSVSSKAVSADPQIANPLLVISGRNSLSNIWPLGSFDPLYRARSGSPDTSALLFLRTFSKCTQGFTLA